MLCSTPALIWNLNGCIHFDTYFNALYRRYINLLFPWHCIFISVVYNMFSSSVFFVLSDLVIGLGIFCTFLTYWQLWGTIRSS